MWYVPKEPADKDHVEDVKNQVRHDPARWSGGMLKAMVGVAVVAVVLVAWALLSLAME